MGGPVFFGVRHLSPAAAFHLRQALDELRPALILVEGPSDLNGQMHWLCHPETQFPAAILAYTRQAPVRTILYPLAVYSPELQAILWAHTHGTACRFMDLPSGAMLALMSFAGLAQEVPFHACPRPFRGAPIQLITAGLMALALVGYYGLNLGRI